MSNSDGGRQGDLTGRVAVVTGAARGIGHAIAAELSAAGVKVALWDMPERADEALAGIAGESCYFSCDVTDGERVKETMAAVVERWGSLHVLVNNAGIAIDGLLMRTKPEQWAKVLEVNLTGAFNCSKAAARWLLKAKDWGRVVNISSVVGERGNVGQSAYAASKAGLLGLTRSLALELGSRGVTVNAITPGFIATQMTDEHLAEPEREKLIASIPLGRAGTPGDVAGVVRFLCSPAASYITGQVLRINGGMYM